MLVGINNKRIMAGKTYNFQRAMAGTPIAQAATEKMVNAFTQPQADATAQDTPSEQPNNNTEAKAQTDNNEAKAPEVNTTANTPVNTTAVGQVHTPIEQLSQRRIQMQSEYSGAAIQAINLKTFPEAGNWKLEEVVRKFNLHRGPGLPRLTKGALAEMLLMDAVCDLYDKMCK